MEIIPLESYSVLFYYRLKLIITRYIILKE